MSWKWHHERAASLGVRSLHDDQHHSTSKKRRVSWPDEFSVALLIDGDHMPAPSIGLFQSLAERLGPLPVQWVYGNWPAGYLKAWQQVLSSHRLEPRECGPVTPGKNTADIALVVDAMEVYTKGIRKFVLVASDSDYTPLVSRLCTYGCLVVVIGKANTPRALQQAASAFHLIDSLVVPERLFSVYERPFPTKSVVLSSAARVVGHEAPSEKTMPLQKEAPPAQLQQWVLERLMSYEGTPSSWVQVPRFGSFLWTQFHFRSKERGYKNITVLLKAFPDVFELRSFKGHAQAHEVRRVKG